MSTMTQTTRDMCQEHAESMKSILEEVWEAIDGKRLIGCTECGGTDEDCTECDGTGEVAATEYEGQEPREFLDEMPLEVVWEKGEPFAVVLGTGGPHIEITGGGRQGGYDLNVYWSGERAMVRGEAVRRTGEYFRELYEELD